MREGIKSAFWQSGGRCCSRNAATCAYIRLVAGTDDQAKKRRQHLRDPNDLQGILSDNSLLRNKAFVAGNWVSAKSNLSFAVRNPASGGIIAQVPDLGIEETRDAIMACQEAQANWAKRTGKERASILQEWFRQTIDNADDLAAILTAEMGKPLAEAKAEIVYGASFLQWFAEEAKRIYGETIPGHQADKRLIVIRQPVGVVASITPWNFPNAMIARKVGPALAAGCGMIARPRQRNATLGACNGGLG